jgi:hypothetical protein
MPVALARDGALYGEGDALTDRRRGELSVHEGASHTSGDLAMLRDAFWQGELPGEEMGEPGLDQDMQQST